VTGEDHATRRHVWAKATGADGTCTRGKSSSGTRVAWIDATRGICVIGVVLMHVCVSLYLEEVGHAGSAAVWQELIDEMTPFRIPALALVSGILLSKRIRQGWSSTALRRSTTTSAWLYTVWLTMFLLFALATGEGVWTQQVPDVQSYLQELVLPRTVLWYIFALAVWAALLSSLRNVEPRLVFGLLVAVSIASFSFAGTPGFDHYISIAQYAFMFAAGVYWRHAIVERTERGPVSWTAMLALAVFAFCWLLNEFAYRTDVSIAVSVPQRLSAAFLLLVGARMLCGITVIRAPLVWIGRRTLPIYVLHPLLIDSIRLIPGHGMWMDHDVIRPVWWPLLVTVAITLVAAAFYELARRTPARILFEVPQWLMRRVTGR